MPYRCLVPLLAVSLALGGCIETIAPEEFEDPAIEDVAFNASLGIDLGDFFPDESGIWVREDESGLGDPIIVGQEAGVYYTGWVASGHRFDGVDESDGPAPAFILGMPGPIEGLTLGLLGMRLGGQRTVLVPPSLGFGWSNLPGVPPGSWLVLEVRLVSIDGQTEPPSDDTNGDGTGS